MKNPIDSQINLNICFNQKAQSLIYLLGKKQAVGDRSRQDALSMLKRIERVAFLEFSKAISYSVSHSLWLEHGTRNTTIGRERRNAFLVSQSEKKIASWGSIHGFIGQAGRLGWRIQWR